MNNEETHIAELERCLLVLEDEKHRVEETLGALRLKKEQQKRQSIITAEVPVSLDPITPDRIKLFVSLFRGRPDVFPKRWDNAKTGRSGYSPACKNEWTKGVCDKPRIPCSACTHQAWWLRGKMRGKTKLEPQKPLYIKSLFPWFESTPPSHTVQFIEIYT